MQDKFDEVLECIGKASEILTKKLAQQLDLGIHQANVHLFEAQAWIEAAQDKYNAN